MYFQFFRSAQFSKINISLSDFGQAKGLIFIADIGLGDKMNESYMFNAWQRMI